jgi:hypothetical protein
MSERVKDTESLKHEILESCVKLKVILSLCLIKHRALKTYGETEKQIHALLTSSLDRGE